MFARASGRRANKKSKFVKNGKNGKRKIRNRKSGVVASVTACAMKRQCVLEGVLYRGTFTNDVTGINPPEGVGVVGFVVKITTTWSRQHPWEKIENFTIEQHIEMVKWI